MGSVQFNLYIAVHPYIFGSLSFLTSYSPFIQSETRPHIPRIHSLLLNKSFLCLKLLSRTPLNEKHEVRSNVNIFVSQKMCLPLNIIVFPNIIEFLSKYSEFHLASKMCFIVSDGTVELYRKEINLVTRR